jgi:hypothetical protein
MPIDVENLTIAGSFIVVTSLLEKRKEGSKLRTLKPICSADETQP